MLNNITVKKDNFKLSKRNYTLKRENQFKTPSIGLIQSFKIIELNCNKLNENLVPSIIIGNFEIVPSLLYNPSNTDTISIVELRNYIRTIDFPETVYDNQLINLEHYFYSQQLKSTEYYYNIKNKDLFESIFTSGINVYLEIKNKDGSKIEESKMNEIKIEEIYWDKIYEN